MYHRRLLGQQLGVLLLAVQWPPPLSMCNQGFQSICRSQSKHTN